MNEEELIKKTTNVKDLALGMATYTGASIIGPLVIFLGGGYIIDKLFDSRPIFMIIGVFVAFIITNIMIFRKLKRLITKFHKHIEEEAASSAKPAEDKEKLGDKQI